MNKKIFERITMIIVIIIIIGIFFILKNKKNNEMSNSNIVMIDTANEENINKNNVSIKIIQDTITKESVDIAIINNSEDYCSFGEEFIIQKKEKDKWEKLNIINNDIAFTSVAYKIDKKNKIQMKVNYGKYYGMLENGSYRIVKSVYNNGHITIYSDEFII